MTEPLLERDTLALLAEALETLESGFAGLPGMADAGAPLPRADPAGLRAVLAETAQRLTDNYPYPHPLYAGQMLKPPHPVARLAYALAMYINPNNHALDGGRASSAMEKEAVAALAAMCGWETHLGHLTGGGTMANLEALWVARELARGDRGSRRDQGDRGGRILAAETAHYTHARVAGVLGVEFEAVAVDARGRMSLPALESLARRGEVAAVVATLGTTGLGAVDPLAEILELPAAIAREHWPEIAMDRDSVLCLRSCLMKPEHEAWVDTIAAMLDETLPD